MSVNERDNTERCLNILLQHLEELRPILNTRELDGRSINSARDLVKAFVLSEINAGPRGTIFRCEHFSETGEPSLGTPLGLNGPYSQVFWSEECADLLNDQQWSYMSMILGMLVAFARESLTRERAELAKEIGNCASDFVESLTGKPWTSNKSILLEVDAATCMAKLGNDQFDIDSQQAARWLKVLADHPGEWFSGRELSLCDPELLDVRTDKLKKELPMNLARLIESKPGRGSRLRLDWLAGRS